MDVLKKGILILVSLILISCNEDAPSDSGTFKRTDTLACEGNAIQGEYLVHWKSGKITIEKYKNDQDFFDHFLALHEDEVQSSEPHYQIEVFKGVEVVTNGYGGGPNWGVDKIEAASAWSKSSQTEVIKVAVIDSGVDITHPQLVDAIAINEDEIINGIDDDGNGLVDDRFGYDFVANSYQVGDYTGHGTHVAGIIAAQHDKGDVKGAAPQAKILPLAFIGDGTGSIDAAIKAIRYAVSQDVRVINASWGGEACSTALRKEIEALAESNVLFVAAAGNASKNISDEPEYPASFILDNQITVGASTFDDKLAFFSNKGDLVHLAAPGAEIFSTYPNERVVALEGTSMAAPFVSAAAALLWAIKPDASYVEIKNAIVEGVVPGPYRVKSRGHLSLPGAMSLLNN